MSHIDHTAFCPEDQTLWVVENNEGFMNPYENTFTREVMIGNSFLYICDHVSIPINGLL